MDRTDITIEILKDIRTEVKDIRTEVTEIRTEVRATNGRIDETNDRLGDLSRRVVESEIRTSTAITELAGTVHELTDVLRATHDLRPRVERCENDISELKRRIP